MIQKVLQLDFQLGVPQSYQNLTIYPLLGGANGHLDYLTLEEAWHAGSVEIQEAGRGTVPELLVINHAEKDLLLIGGEELLGGLQNRAVNVSILVAARSSLNIPVSCTERGRWHAGQTEARMQGASGHFSSVQVRQILNRSVGESLEARGSYHSDQPGIWESIGDTLSDFGITSHTSAHSDIFEEKAGDIEEYLGCFRSCGDQAGMVAQIHGAIASLDLFGRADTFARVFPKLLRSYALEAIHQKGAAGREDGDIAGFIQDLKTARVGRHPAPGRGDHLRLEGERQSAMALALEGHLVHLCSVPAK